MRNDNKRPVKDERDQLIETSARSHALEWVTAVTQILTIICIVKGNPAWKGTLSILFFGIGFTLIYKFEQYREKPYKLVGLVSLLVGIGLLLCFGITG